MNDERPPAAVDEDEPELPFEEPRLVGRHVVLRPISAEDYRNIRLAETGSGLTARWRLRGSTPSPDQWSQSIWQSVLAQFIVVATGSSAPLGLVVVYRPSFQDQYAYLGAASFEPRQRSPLMVLGAALFIEYVFHCWNFHKLYLELPEYNLDQLRGGVPRLFQIEARLREHSWYGGRRWDQLVLALYRDAWRHVSARVLSVEAPASERTVHVRLPATPPRGA